MSPLPPGNPFPGMDPWMQQNWSGTRSALAVRSCFQIQGRLPDDLIACADRREELAEAADVWNWATGSLAPLARRPRDQKTEPRVSIRRTVDWDAVTVVEFLGPEDKCSAAGRDRYVRYRAGWRAAGVNMIEIDLTRGGRRPMIGPPPGVDETAYAVNVWRADAPDRTEFYRLAFRDPLPAFRVPLRPGDEDVVLELQPAVDAAHLGGGAHKLNRSRPPDPPLSGADAAWADGRLAAARRGGSDRGSDRMNA